MGAGVTLKESRAAKARLSVWEQEEDGCLEQGKQEGSSATDLGFRPDSAVPWQERLTKLSGTRVLISKMRLIRLKSALQP